MTTTFDEPSSERRSSGVAFANTFRFSSSRRAAAAWPPETSIQSWSPYMKTTGRPFSRLAGASGSEELVAVRKGLSSAGFEHDLEVVIESGSEFKGELFWIN